MASLLISAVRLKIIMSDTFKLKVGDKTELIN